MVAEKTIRNLKCKSYLEKIFLYLNAFFQMIYLIMITPNKT